MSPRLVHTAGPCARHFWQHIHAISERPSPSHIILSEPQNGQLTSSLETTADSALGLLIKFQVCGHRRPAVSQFGCSEKAGLQCLGSCEVLRCPCAVASRFGSSVRCLSGFPIRAIPAAPCPQYSGSHIRMGRFLRRVRCRGRNLGLCLALPAVGIFPTKEPNCR